MPPTPNHNPDLAGPLPVEALNAARLGPRADALAGTGATLAISDGWEARTVVHGNPEVGIVHFVTQLHPSPKTTEAMKALIANSQALVFHKLAALGVTDVFPEGRGAVQKAGDGTPRKVFEVIFPGGRIPNPASGEILNPRQAMMLHNGGAAPVYAALKGGVTLHPTTTMVFEEEMLRDAEGVRTERKHCLAIGDAAGAASALARYDAVVIDRRDRFTGALVLGHLSAARMAGSVTPEAAIVCGGFHHFDERAFLSAEKLLDVAVGEGSHHFDDLPIIIKYVHPELSDRFNRVARERT